MVVIKPVFIIGSGRSGTTMLDNVMAAHNDLSYINKNILRSRIHRHSGSLGSSLVLLGKIFNRIYTDYQSQMPIEANPFWIRYFGTYEYLTEPDYTQEMADYFYRNIGFVQKVFGRPRFLNKNPQHSFRVRLLNKIFPDMKLIHIIRDGRAVAYSRYVKEQKRRSVFARNVKKNSW